MAGRNALGWLQAGCRRQAGCRQVGVRRGRQGCGRNKRCLPRCVVLLSVLDGDVRSPNGFWIRASHLGIEGVRGPSVEGRLVGRLRVCFVQKREPVGGGSGLGLTDEEGQILTSLPYVPLKIASLWQCSLNDILIGHFAIHSQCFTFTSMYTLCGIWYCIGHFFQPAEPTWRMRRRFEISRNCSSQKLNTAVASNNNPRSYNSFPFLFI